MPKEIELNDLNVIMEVPDDFDDHDINNAIAINYPDYFNEEGMKAVAQSQSILKDRGVKKAHEEQYGILSKPAAIAETVKDSAVAGAKSATAFAGITAAQATDVAADIGDATGATRRGIDFSLKAISMAAEQGRSPAQKYMADSMTKYAPKTISPAQIDATEPQPSAPTSESFDVKVAPKKTELTTEMRSYSHVPAAIENFKKVDAENKPTLEDARAPLSPKESTLGMVTADVAGGLGSTTPTVAANFLPYVGPFASMAVGGLQVAADTFSQALERGDDYDTALGKAYITGVASAPLEAIGARVIAKGTKSFWAFRGVTDPKDIPVPTTRLGQAATRAAEGFGSEAITEGLESATQQYVLDQNIEVGQMLYESFIGGLSGGILGGSVGIASPVSKRPKDMDEARAVMPDLVTILERNDRTEVLGAYLRGEASLAQVLDAANVDAKTRTRYSLLDVHFPADGDIETATNRLRVVEQQIRSMIRTFYDDIPADVANKMDPTAPLPEQPLATEQAAHQGIPEFGIPIEQTRDFLALKNEQGILREQIKQMKNLEKGLGVNTAARLEALKKIEPELISAIESDPIIEKFSRGVYTAEEIFQAIHDVIYTRSSSIFSYDTSMNILSWAYQNKGKTGVIPGYANGRIEPAFRLPEQIANVIHRATEGTPLEKSLGVELANNVLMTAAKQGGHETIDSYIAETGLTIVDFANMAAGDKFIQERNAGTRGKKGQRPLYEENQIDIMVTLEDLGEEVEGGPYYLAADTYDYATAAEFSALFPFGDFEMSMRMAQQMIERPLVVRRDDGSREGFEDTVIIWPDRGDRTQWLTAESDLIGLPSLAEDFMVGEDRYLPAGTYDQMTDMGGWDRPEGAISRDEFRSIADNLTRPLVLRLRHTDLNNIPNGVPHTLTLNPEGSTTVILYPRGKGPNDFVLPVSASVQARIRAERARQRREAFAKLLDRIVPATEDHLLSEGSPYTPEEYIAAKDYDVLTLENAAEDSFFTNTISPSMLTHPLLVRYSDGGEEFIHISARLSRRNVKRRHLEYPLARIKPRPIAIVEGIEDKFFNRPPVEVFAMLSKQLTKPDLYWSHINIENLRSMARENKNKVTKEMILQLLRENQKNLTVYNVPHSSGEWGAYQYRSPNNSLRSYPQLNVRHDYNAAGRYSPVNTFPQKEDLLALPYRTEPNDAARTAHGGGDSSIGHILFQDGFVLSTTPREELPGLFVIEIQTNSSGRKTTVQEEIGRRLDELASLIGPELGVSRKGLNPTQWVDEIGAVLREKEVAQWDENATEEVGLTPEQEVFLSLYKESLLYDPDNGILEKAGIEPRPLYPYQEGRTDALIIHALQTAHAKGYDAAFFPRSFNMVSHIEWGGQITETQIREQEAKLRQAPFRAAAVVRWRMAMRDGLNSENLTADVRQVKTQEDLDALIDKYPFLPTPDERQVKEEENYIIQTGNLNSYRSQRIIGNLYANELPRRIEKLFKGTDIKVEEVKGIDGRADFSITKVTWGPKMQEMLEDGPQLGYKEGPRNGWTGVFLKRDKAKMVGPVIGIVSKKASPRTVVHELMHFLMHEMKPDALRALGAVVIANDPSRAGVDFGNINNWKQGVQNGRRYNDHELAASAWSAFLLHDGTANKELAPIYADIADTVRGMLREYPRDLALKIPQESRDFFTTLFNLHELNRQFDPMRAHLRVEEIRQIAALAMEEGVKVRNTRGGKTTISVDAPGENQNRPFFESVETEFNELFEEDKKMAPAWNPRWDGLEKGENSDLLDWLHMFGDLEGGQRAEVNRQAIMLLHSPEAMAETLRRGKRDGAGKLEPFERSATLMYAYQMFRAIREEGVSPEDSLLLEDLAGAYGQLFQDAKSLPSAELAIMNMIMGTDKLQMLFEGMSEKQKSVIMEYVQEGFTANQVVQLLEGLGELERNKVRRWIMMYDVYARSMMLSGILGRIRDVSEGMINLSISPLRDFFQIAAAKSGAAVQSALLMKRVRSGRTFKELKPWVTMWLSPAVTEDGRRTITSPVLKRFLESGKQVIEMLLLRRNLTDFATQYDETMLSKTFVDMAVHDKRLGRKVWGRAVTYPYRLVQAIDLMMKAQTRPIYQEAFAARVEEWKKSGIYEEQLERFVRRKAEQLRLGRAAEKALLEQAKVDPSILIDNAAKMMAEKLAFQSDPGVLARSITQAFAPSATKTVPHSLLRSWVIPFVTAPVNLAKMGAELTPGIGMVTPWGGRSWSERFGDQLTGFALIALLELAKETGWLTGAEPEDEEEARLLRERGWKPWSFKYTLGDEVYYQPMPIFLRIPFGMYEQLVNIAKNPSTHPMDVGLAFMKAGRFLLESVRDSTFLRGIGDTYEILFPSYNNSEEAQMQRLLNSGFRHAGSLMPYSSFWRSIHKMMDDQGSYDTWVRPEDWTKKGAVDVLGEEFTLSIPFIKIFGYGIPGIIDDIPARIDLFGEPITNKQILEKVPQAWLPVPILGGSNIEQPLDLVERELMNIEFIPEPPRRSRNVLGREVEMLDEEYRQYMMSYGIRFKMRMEDNMRRGLWATYSPEKKMEKASQYAQDAREAAWRETLRMIPAIKERARTAPRGAAVSAIGRVE